MREILQQNLSQADRDKLKQASQSLLTALRELLTPMYDWTKNTGTQAEVKVFILDNLWQKLPRPSFTDQETEALASRVYDYIWQRSASTLFRTSEAILEEPPVEEEGELYTDLFHGYNLLLLHAFPLITTSC